VVARRQPAARFSRFLEGRISMNVVALLLAAGESERMGTPKALLEWRGLPLLTHQLQHIQKSRIHDCIVVLGKGAADLERLVKAPMRPGWKARPVYNPRYRDGKCASIQAGLAAIDAPPDGILVASVDQPLHHRLLNALLRAAETDWEKCDAAGRHRIIVPTFHGRPGHPPLFCASIFAELMGISEESQGLKAVVRRSPSRVLGLPWHDDEILLNLNAPVDLPSSGLRELR
jgi:molybdenum cofactor cytidylyltransferase